MRSIFYATNDVSKTVKYNIVNRVMKPWRRNNDDRLNEMKSKKTQKAEKKNGLWKNLNQYAGLVLFRGVVAERVRHDRPQKSTWLSEPIRLCMYTSEPVA